MNTELLFAQLPKTMFSDSVKKIPANLGTLLLTVGVALFTVGVAEREISRFLPSIPHFLYTFMLVGGLALVALGLVALVVSLALSPAELLLANASREAFDPYNCTFATEADVGRLRSFYQEYFGTDVPSAALMQAWIRRNPRAFAMVHRVEEASIIRTTHSLVGSFKVLMLTPQAVDELVGQLVTGTTFKSAHLARKPQEAAGFYVGDVVATTRFARGILLAYLNVACAPAIRNAIPIYARPLSRDGKRVMTQHGFVQVSDDKSPPEIGKICRLGTARFERLPAAMRTGARKKQTTSAVGSRSSQSSANGSGAAKESS